MKFIIGMLFFCCFWIAFPSELQALPVDDPNEGIHQFSADTYFQYLLPGWRAWGLALAILGGFLVVFGLLMVVLLLGTVGWMGYFYFSIAAFIGGLMLMMGVQQIDQSYIIYSSNKSLENERIRPLMIRDFVFAFLLIGLAIALLLIRFFTSAWILLFAAVAMLILAFLKWSSYKRNR